MPVGRMRVENSQVAATAAVVVAGTVGLLYPVVAAAVGTPLTKVQVTPKGHAAHVVAVLAEPWAAHWPSGQAVQSVRAPATTVAA